MDTLLVRLKPYDPRRGHVLRRYTYAGIRFAVERGWYRVEKPVADYLRDVHQVPSDDHSPLAFDVMTEADAKATEAREVDAAKQRRSATDDLQVTVGRPATPTAAAPPVAPPAASATPTTAGRDDDKDPRRPRRERE